MKRLALLSGLLLGFFISADCTVRIVAAQPSHATTATDLPSWVKDVGARGAPKSGRVFTVKAVADGTTNSTSEIQQAIDDCAKAGGGIVTLTPGNYVTGALFLKSNVHLRIDK
jgi:polygalacturonase